jgi:hypothetical protein
VLAVDRLSYNAATHTSIDLEAARLHREEFSLPIVIIPHDTSMLYITPSALCSCECSFVSVSASGRFYESLSFVLGVVSHRPQSNPKRNSSMVPNNFDFMQAQAVVHSGHLLSCTRRIIGEFSRRVVAENSSSLNFVTEPLQTIPFAWW